MKMGPDGVDLLGYGVYDGLQTPPPGRINVDSNPRITLDNGDVVWGFECWWGSEEQIKKEVEHYRKGGAVVNAVSILSYRSPKDGGNVVH
jgi:hypothetical protein